MFKQISKKIIVVALLATPFLLQADEAHDKGIKSAHGLFETIDMKHTYKEMIDNIFGMQVQQNPALKNIEKEMKDFFEKYMGWSAIKDDMAEIYAKNYTSKELNELNAFYKTPIGQKTAKLMPKLASEGARLGQNRVNAHMGELQTMIINAMKKDKN
jgi:hypothetical protein